jgi:hypothetical protein
MSALNAFTGTAFRLDGSRVIETSSIRRIGHIDAEVLDCETQLMGFDHEEFNEKLDNLRMTAASWLESIPRGKYTACLRDRVDTFVVETAIVSSTLLSMVDYGVDCSAFATRNYEALDKYWVRLKEAAAGWIEEEPDDEFRPSVGAGDNPNEVEPKRQRKG